MIKMVIANEISRFAFDDGNEDQKRKQECKDDASDHGWPLSIPEKDHPDKCDKCRDRQDPENV
jgi:hypothetical protein